MRTSVDEIADGIYRISTFIPEVAAPAGFTFNQFVVDAEEPLLYHTGMRQLFPVVCEQLPESFPSSGCVGSPSATSSPTSPAP